MDDYFSIISNFVSRNNQASCNRCIECARNFGFGRAVSSIHGSLHEPTTTPGSPHTSVSMAMQKLFEASSPFVNEWLSRALRRRAPSGLDDVIARILVRHLMMMLCRQNCPENMKRIVNGLLKKNLSYSPPSVSVGIMCNHAALVHVCARVLRHGCAAQGRQQRFCAMRHPRVSPAVRQYLTRREVAEEYGFSKRFLEALAAAGRGPALIKATARKVLYRRVDVEAWLDSLRVEPKSSSQDTQ